MSKIEIVLRDPVRREKQLSLWIEPNATPIASRWSALLARTLEVPHRLIKPFSFLGWPDGPRPLKLLLSEMNNAIEGLNRYNEKGHWDPPYIIKERCRADAITQAELNRLHFHFETLRGQVWNESQYAKTADPAAFARIEYLNRLVHEIEYLERSKERVKLHGEPIPVIGTPLSEIKPGFEWRFSLEKEDYEQFDLHKRFGDVYLKYCQTGKRHLDVWRDDDVDVSDANINGLRYYSGMFVLYLGTAVPDHEARHWHAVFRDWLRARGACLEDSKCHFVDSNGVTQGIGELKVGRLSLEPFEGKSPGEIRKLIGSHPDIFKLRVHEGDTLSEAVYPRAGVECPSFRTSLASLES